MVTQVTPIAQQHLSLIVTATAKLTGNVSTLAAAVVVALDIVKFRGLQSLGELCISVN